MRVQFDTTAFEFAHGKMPRGQGSWAFCPADKYRRDDYLQFVFWSAPASFAAAKAEARRHFAALGVAEVVVCS